MMPKVLRSLRIVMVAFLLANLLPGSAVQAQASQTTYSGQATVVRATALGVPIILSDTGPLPPEGGSKEAALLEANVLGVLSAQVLHASTVGQGNHSRSEASVANLNLTVGGNTIKADFLMARATAECKNPGQAPSLSGSSEIASLVINGQTTTVSGQPNQTISLPGGVTIVINEQIQSRSGQMGAITVNALHATAPGIAGVVVSSAHADITCAKPVCPGGDFVTGGGWIVPPSGAKANFGVAGGIKQGAFWGHLVSIDHGTSMKVRGTSVTAYAVLDDVTREIKGTAEINGQSGFTYRVVVADKGEPGRADTFALELSNGYKAQGSLGGGNIQLHKPCPQQ